MDYQAFLNRTSNRRHPSVLRSLFDNIGVDHSYMMMAGGLPSPNVFPITSADFTLSDGSSVRVEGQEMQEALQYGYTAGHPGIREFTRHMISHIHNPPLMEDARHPGTPMIVCTSGSQDGIYKVFECIVDEGDTVLVDEPVYASVISVLKPLGCHIEGIPTDKHGIIPEHLAQVLSKWKRPDDNKPARDTNGGKLKALYLIPNGGNPSGARYTLERKREIYRLAHEYNFLIIEDEAYFFLEKKPYSKSFLSLDVDGRVIRLDTFSKTVAPGFRVGTVTGPTTLVKKVLSVSMASSQGCGMVAQTILVKLLNKWGLDGYIEHCERVAEFYDMRRKQCMELVDKHLKDLVEYNAPSGGMFLWIKCKSLRDTLDLCLTRLPARKVLMVAGSAFIVDEENGSPYIRVSFTMANLEEIEKAFKILAEEIQAMSSDVPSTNGV